MHFHINFIIPIVNHRDSFLLDPADYSMSLTTKYIVGNLSSSAFVFITLESTAS